MTKAQPNPEDFADFDVLYQPMMLMPHADDARRYVGVLAFADGSVVIEVHRVAVSVEAPPCPTVHLFTVRYAEPTPMRTTDVWPLPMYEAHQRGRGTPTLREYQFSPYDSTPARVNARVHDAFEVQLAGELPASPKRIGLTGIQLPPVGVAAWCKVARPIPDSHGARRTGGAGAEPHRYRCPACGLSVTCSSPLANTKCYLCGDGESVEMERLS